MDGDQLVVRRRVDSPSSRTCADLQSGTATPSQTTMRGHCQALTIHLAGIPPGHRGLASVTHILLPVNTEAQEHQEMDYCCCSCQGGHFEPRMTVTLLQPRGHHQSNPASAFYSERN